MNPAVRLSRFVTLAGLALPAGLFAQARFDNTAIPLQFLETSPWTVTAGARYATEGASVNFGQLGSIRAGLAVTDIPSTATQLVYDNGAVNVDGRRQDEVDAAGQPLPTTNGRYQRRVVDSAGNETFEGDYLAYVEGRTRNWGFGSASQVTSDGRIALSTYGVQSSGASAISEKTASGGFEVGVNRRLRRFGRRAEVGASVLFGLNDINAGASGTISAKLISLTDYYRFYGTLPENLEKGYSAPSPVTSTGGLESPETTVPIDQLPFERQLITLPNPVNVLGSWKINGAYYVVRMGPTVRVFVTDRLAFSFEAGLAAAFVGTSFEVRESIELSDLANPITTVEQADDTKVLTGFYGSGSAEYWMTDRTHAYMGAGYESLGNYQQGVSGRTAEIDVGSTVTVRMGLTTRF
jgi:hypothetical protein